MDGPGRETILSLTLSTPRTRHHRPAAVARRADTSIYQTPAREDRMDTAPLTLFARKISASNRLLFADLRRLRRDVLPAGITRREEAEVLLDLDHIERLDEEWAAYLAEAVTA